MVKNLAHTIEIICIIMLLWNICDDIISIQSLFIAVPNGKSSELYDPSIFLSQKDTEERMIWNIVLIYVIRKQEALDNIAI